MSDRQGPGRDHAGSDAAGKTGPAVVIIGFMGSGKSRVGTLLARLLGVPFVDTDRLVEAELGPIEAVFSGQGEQAFREAERRVVLASLDDLDRRPAVVSLGGGAVGDDDVRGALRAVPHVVWLGAPVDVLWDRVRRAATRGRGRPLARDEATFRRLLGEREALYREVATVEVVNDGGLSAAEVAETVAERVREAT